jgi:arylsulfatase A-like enzyme/Flp pilus assembly protein TadD
MQHRDDPVPAPTASTRRLAVSAVASIVVGLAIAGCGGEKPAPSLLLVTLDTTRADRLSCYGSSSPVTPHIDEIASRGVLFEQASSPTPLTLPAHASILTGVSPARHGLRTNADRALSEEWTTLAEILSRAGYRTAAFVSSFVLDRKFGLAQGFDVYSDELPPGPAGGEGPERDATAVAREASAWLRGVDEEPFFLWIHFYDPHTPYSPPEPYRGSYPRDPYAGEIAHVDAAVGRILDTLEAEGLVDRSWIVVAGDHGESLGEKGERTHGILVHEAVTRVPLIWAGPGILSSHRVAAPVRLTDVAATALDLLLGRTSTSESTLTGSASLRPWLEGRTGPSLPCPLESYHPFLHYGWAPIVGIREGDWKLVTSTQEALYDVSTDRSEERNRIAERPEIAVRLRSLAESVVREARDAGDPEPAPVALDEADRRRLAALGYAAPALPPSASTSSIPAMDRWHSLPDPHLRVGVVDRLEQAARAIRAGRFESAADSYRTILESEPDQPRALNGLGVCLLRAGRFRDALPLLERAVARDPGFASAFANLGAALDQAGRRDEAARHYRRALALDATQEGAARNLALLHLESGDFAGAREALRIQLEIRPDRPDTLALLARCEEELGHPGEALLHLERASSLDPANPGIWIEMGRVALRAGRRDLARRAADRLSNVDPVAAETLRRQLE